MTHTQPDTLTIGQLARAADVPVSTLRYYERIGLVKPLRRPRGSYRAYGHDSVALVRAIRLAQGVGLSLTDIAELAALQGERGFYRQLKDRLRRRLAEVDGEIETLRQLRGRLNEAIDCCGHDPSCYDQCVTFEQTLPTGCSEESADCGLDLAPGCKA